MKKPQSPERLAWCPESGETAPTKLLVTHGCWRGVGPRGGSAPKEARFRRLLPSSRCSLRRSLALWTSHRYQKSIIPDAQTNPKNARRCNAMVYDDDELNIMCIVMTTTVVLASVGALRAPAVVVLDDGGVGTPTGGGGVEPVPPLSLRPQFSTFRRIRV